jgi:hypothetical protein
MHCLRFALAASALAGLAACSSSSSSSVHNPTFSDVSAAPAAIQTAAGAVVRIILAEEVATGSFVSADGKLLTNNHVLGVGQCPVEGCFAKITFAYQRGVSPAPSDTQVFIVPIAVDVGLDMALVQVKIGMSGPALTTPNYLTIDSHDAASLVGTHVHVVGHPEGHLKKWTQGEVVDTDGTWIQFSAFSLPGNSGSPILDDSGHMVGILHRGPSVQDLFTANGADEWALGTASSALLAAMSAPLPAVMWSVLAPTTDDGVAQYESVYLNAHQATANVGGTQKPVIDSLGVACDKGLADQAITSPESLSSALAPCFAAERWISCSAPTGAPQSSFGVCPTDASAWMTRFQGAFDRWHALNGDLELLMVSFAPAKLQGQSVGATLLQQALMNASPPLDFNLASYLAAFGIDTYAGKDLVSFVQNYKSYPDYGLYGGSVADAALWLENSGALTADQALAIEQALYGDPSVDLGSRLFIEESLYRSGVLN